MTAVAQPQGAVSPSGAVYDQAISPFAVAAMMGVSSSHSPHATSPRCALWLHSSQAQLNLLPIVNPPLPPSSQHPFEESPPPDLAYCLRALLHHTAQVYTESSTTLRVRSDPVQPGSQSSDAADAGAYPWDFRSAMLRRTAAVVCLRACFCLFVRVCVCVCVCVCVIFGAQLLVAPAPAPVHALALAPAPPCFDSALASSLLGCDSWPHTRHPFRSFVLGAALYCRFAQQDSSNRPRRSILADVCMCVCVCALCAGGVVSADTRCANCFHFQHRAYHHPSLTQAAAFNSPSYASPPPLMHARTHARVQAHVLVHVHSYTLEGAHTHVWQRKHYSM